MTISDAMPHLWASSLRIPTAGTPATPQATGAENALEFRIGPERTPAEAERRSHRFAALALPALLRTPLHRDTPQAVLAVLTELVDITARHRASLDLAGRISYDGDHVLITVSAMDKPLPPPEEEPGLYSVHRYADDYGQHSADECGYATWASVPIQRPM